MMMMMTMKVKNILQMMKTAVVTTLLIRPLMKESTQVHLVVVSSNSLLTFLYFQIYQNMPFVLERGLQNFQVRIFYREKNDFTCFSTLCTQVQLTLIFLGQLWQAKQISQCNMFKRLHTQSFTCIMHYCYISLQCTLLGWCIVILLAECLLGGYSCTIGM